MSGEWRVVSLAAVLLGVAAGAGAQEAAVRAAVEAANKKFMAAVAKGDAAALASLYATDAHVFPSHSDIVKGRAAIQALWESVIDSGIAAADVATLEVEASGPLAVVTGTYVMKTRDGRVADRGKYMVVWKKVGGQWLIHRDISNTSQPAAKP